MRRLLIACMFSALCASAAAQAVPLDSDHDGLSDTFEDALLQRFAPRFMISADDCSVQPARFVPDIAVPTVAAEDSTVYGQAFPRKDAPTNAPEIELHFYHLWRTDCGRMGHPLDAEHVAVLLQRNPSDQRDDAKAWHAVYWYAAAHEDTVCDASHLTRASTIDAEEHGAKVWISAGKHASFLNEELCHHGCGGDRCVHSKPLDSPAVMNLGEWNAPMTGAVWMSSTQWPLKDKLGRSNFLTARVNRLQRLPDTDIAWANPAKRPEQELIHSGSATGDALATSGSALATSGHNTDSALTLTADKTGNALDKAARSTGHALGSSVHAVRKALGLSKKDDSTEKQQEATPAP